MRIDLSYIVVRFAMPLVLCASTVVERVQDLVFSLPINSLGYAHWRYSAAVAYTTAG